MSSILVRSAITSGLLLALGTVGCSCGDDDGRPGGDGGGADRPDIGLMDGQHRDIEVPGDGPDQDAFFAMDPPPEMCLENGMRVPGSVDGPVGGTPECPDDKNRQGCPCFTIGERAACWPGLRVNRNRGQCHDGMTTCELRGEFGAWGPCQGYVLPDPDAEIGPASCKCFSAGRWSLANLNPCFVSYGSTLYGVSTILRVCSDVNAERMAAGEPLIPCPGGDNAALIAQCPDLSGDPPPPAPAQPWTPGTLKVDCTGRYELCYTLKAGPVEEASPDDCVIAQACAAPEWYREADVTQDWPSLSSWASSNSACIAEFGERGGYGEMTVRGLSSECDNIGTPTGPGEVDDLDDLEFVVFNRIPYCPAECSEVPRPDPLPEICDRCGMGGSGDF